MIIFMSLCFRFLPTCSATETYNLDLYVATVVITVNKCDDRQTDLCIRQKKISHGVARMQKGNVF